MHTRLLLFLLSLFVVAGQLSAQERVAYLNNSSNPTNPSPSDGFIGVKEVNFELDGGIILVEAVLNHTVQTFVLDSGAPGLILNNFQKKGKKELMTGVNGTVEAFAVTIENFTWAEISYPKIAATSMDLSHLESMTKRKISGLIGYDLIKDFELLLDYAAQVIQIKSVGATFINTSQPVVSFPLLFENHLLVIEAVIGNEKLRLGLDTGAEINLLDDRLSPQIANVASEPQPYGKIYGVGERQESAKLIKVALTRVARAAYRQMDYVLTDFSSITDDGTTNIDGILGFPFLSSCKFSIDFKTQQLHVWP